MSDANFTVNKSTSIDQHSHPAASTHEQSKKEILKENPNRKESCCTKLKDSKLATIWMEIRYHWKCEKNAVPNWLGWSFLHSLNAICWCVECGEGNVKVVNLFDKYAHFVHVNQCFVWMNAFVTWETSTRALREHDIAQLGVIAKGVNGVQWLPPLAGDKNLINQTTKRRRKE